MILKANFKDREDRLDINFALGFPNHKVFFYNVDTHNAY